MSRDFKQEYEQHMNEQTPDLWARIEANLPVKEATVTGNAAAEVTDTSNVVPMKHRGHISRRWMTYGMTAAAALVICLLAVPVLRSAQGGKNESDNFMARDGAFEMVVEDAAADTGTMENGMKYNADGIMTSSGGNSGGSAAPEKAVQQEECEVEEQMATDADTVANDANDSDKMESMEVAESTTKVAGETEAGVATEDATDEASTPAQNMEDLKAAAFAAEVTILEMFEQDGRVLYRADIGGREGILTFGEFSEEPVLSVGEMYELSLETVDGDVDWDYEIVGME